MKDLLRGGRPGGPRFAGGGLAILLAVWLNCLAPEPLSAQTTRSDDGGWGYLGVYLGDLTADRASSLGLADWRGVVVGMVERGSPAAKAGLRQNDCLLTIDSRPIVNRLQFFQSLMVTPPGTKLRLGVLRDGERQEIEVEIGMRLSPAMAQRRRLFDEADALLRSAEENRRMAEEARAKGDEKGAARFIEIEATLRQMSDDSRAWVEKELREGRISEPIAVQSFNLNLTLSARRYQLGVTVVQLSSQLAEAFNAATTRGGGLLLSEVRPGGAAEVAGVKAGDCLLRVNDQETNTPADLNRAVDQAVVNAAAGTPVDLVLTIVRERVRQQISLRL